MASGVGFHAEQLARRCRVCGKVLAAKPTPPLAEKFAEELLYLFGIDLRLDDAERCPKKLCSTCSIIVKRNYRTETKSGVPHLSAVHVIR